MDSPEQCDSVKESSKPLESKSSDTALKKQRKESKADTQPPDVVEEMCESYFASIKTNLFLSSLYLVLISNVVLLSVLLAFAKVTLFKLKKFKATFCMTFRGDLN